MKNGTVQVRGVEYGWSVYRQPRWTGDGVLLGLALLVKPVKSPLRELVLEFAIDRTRYGDMPDPQRFRVSKRQLTECIEKALDEGWDPESRGKAIFLRVGQVV